MKVAITGSHGLIGRTLAHSLRCEGHDVVAVVRPGSGPGDGPTIAWNPEAGSIDAARLEGVDAVVHLAGQGVAEKRWTPEQKERIRDSRVRGTRLIAEAVAGLAASGGPQVLVTASAIGYYGDRGNERLDESSAPGTSFLARVCIDWEAATEAAVEAGVRVARCRSGLILTPDGGLLQKMLPFYRLGLGGPLGNGHQWSSWITLDDEIGAIRFLLDHDVEGAVNLTAPNPVTNRDLARTIGRVLRRPAIIPIPRFAPGLLYGRELVDELFSGQHVQPTVLEKAGYRFLDPLLEPALRTMLGKPRAGAAAAG